MASCDDIADYDWLTGAEAGALLDELATSCDPLHVVADRLRRRCSQERAHLVLDQLQLRRRATAKFACAERMFFTPLGLEQATDQWVAQYKAARFAGRGPVADLCCGIGGDLLALAPLGPIAGVDRDLVAARLAAANARAVLTADRADNVSLETREVDGYRLSGLAAWHIDPDRRPGGHRTTSLAWCSPDGKCIERLLREVPHAAVKLAPATIVPDDWQRRCELEWIGRDRQCRQLVAWHGDLAEQPGLRRVTVLSPETAADGRHTVRSIVGQPKQPVPIAARIDRYVLEPDPAVLAARLTGVLAAEHGLTALAPGPTYLTGPQAVSDEALACFEVVDVLPLRVGELSRYLRERGIGQLEIKQRGVDLQPERLRTQLKLRGDRAATLLVTRVAGRSTAIVAKRVGPTPGHQPPLSPSRQASYDGRSSDIDSPQRTQSTRRSSNDREGHVNR